MKGPKKSNKKNLKKKLNERNGGKKYNFLNRSIHKQKKKFYFTWIVSILGTSITSVLWNFRSWFLATNTNYYNYNAGDSKTNLMMNGVFPLGIEYS
ncbi:unnamed protein product [Rhizophagus irregularis]|nr:unnamed protein product [Rhizophagus irregularis]